MLSKNDVVSLDWLTTSIFFEGASKFYNGEMIYQLAHSAQVAMKNGKPEVVEIGETSFLVEYMTNAYIRADVEGARCRFKLPPYAPNDSNAAVKAEWSGQPFYNAPAMEVVAPLLGFLQKHANLGKTCVSRVDLAVDLPGVDIEPFHRAEEKDLYICRAKKTARYKDAGRVNTLYVGRRPVMMRIYDKWAQLEAEKNAGKLASFELRVLGKKPSTRVEFQIRGERLKHLSKKDGQNLGGVHTLPGLLVGWGNVGKNCATDFCRMVKRRSTKTASCKLTEEWERVLAVFDKGECFNTGDAYEVQPPDVSVLMRSAIGSLGRAAYDLGKRPTNKRELKSEILAMVDAFLDGSEAQACFEAWQKKVSKVQHQQGTKARGEMARQELGHLTESEKFFMHLRDGRPHEQHLREVFKGKTPF